MKQGRGKRQCSQLRTVQARQATTDLGREDGIPSARFMDWKVVIGVAVETTMGAVRMHTHFAALTMLHAPAVVVGFVARNVNQILGVKPGTCNCCVANTFVTCTCTQYFFFFFFVQ